MAKISPVSIKYIVHAKFEADGSIEKPDMIGAVFGQTEGLLGDDLEMRELQRAGKIGRIEVSMEYSDGKTSGEIEVPSAMDKTETTLIAAALETIERVGPSDVKISILDIEDVRGSKRDYILDRAKKLMERFGGKDNEISEMSDEVKSSVKVGRISTYGTENLPCGDLSGEEIIIVEGRADVVNMLKKGISNVIAMDGAKLPKSIIDLSKEKEVTLFVDGDRGGSLIIKNVSASAEINFIAMAPEGKEVEELTEKEILQSLRKKVPANEYSENDRRRGVRRYEERDDRRDRRDDRREENEVRKVTEIKKMSDDDKDKIKDEVKSLSGSKSALIFNDNLEIINKVPISRLRNVRINENAYVIAIDGAATPRVLENCENLGCSNLIANTFVSTDTNINLVSL